MKRILIFKWMATGVIAALFLPMTLNAQVNVSLGDIDPGDSVTITYEVTIDTPPPAGLASISSQGTVTGSNFSDVSTDDPETAGSNDATVTALNPVANADTIERHTSENVKVKLTTLLSNDSDAQNSTLSITGVTSPTPGGATVAISGNWLYYTRNGAAADSFTYTLSDGEGGTATGLVNVNIKDANAQFTSVLSITVDGSGAHLRADGIPLRTYVIQFKDNINDPWQDLGNASADAQGIYTFDDPAGSILRFYRSVFREP